MMKVLHQLARRPNQFRDWFRRNLVHSHRQHHGEVDEMSGAVDDIPPLFRSSSHFAVRRPVVNAGGDFPMDVSVSDNLTKFDRNVFESVTLMYYYGI